MASSTSRLSLVNSYASAFLILLTSTKNATGCYTSLFGFGDSLTDTGNLVNIYPPDDPPHVAFPPYGETFFHFPTGRCSDGRLIIDFIAEYYGLPLVPPYVEGKNAKRTNFHKGCSEFLQTSLFLLGPFGGNDYNHSFYSKASMDEIQLFVPLLAKAIGSAINELIDLGAVTLVVPGMLSFGCLAAYLTYFESSNETEYDSMGCLIWPNKFIEHHNELLQTELNEIRQLHPHATIIYPLFHSPEKYGFMRGAIVACCGTGSLYNYKISMMCGERPFLGCDNPSLYVDWDGYHLTEAAYSLMSKNLLDGPYTIPQINSACVSLVAPTEYSFYI